MDKMYSSGDKGIITLLEKRCVEMPYKATLSLFKDSLYTGHRIEALIVANYFEKKFTSSSRQKRDETMKRNQAILAMLYDCMWNKDLAEMHSLERKDVDDYYSLKLHMFLFMFNDVEIEFRKYINSEAIERYNIEKEKADKYRAGSSGAKYKGRSTLMKLIAINKYLSENLAPPKLIIQEELWGNGGNSEDIIVSLNRGLENLKAEYNSFTTNNIDGVRVHSYKGDGITQHKYRTNRNKIQSKIKLIQLKKERYFRMYFLDGEANENFVFIQAVGISKLSRNKVGSTDALSVTSVGHGKALIREYSRWFNKKNEEVIRLAREERERLKSKDRSSLTRAVARLKKQERDEKVISLFLSGVTNAVEISKEVDVKERTVRDIIKRYLDSEVKNEELSEEETRQLEIEKEEEDRAKKIILEREYKKIKREEKKRIVLEYEKSLVKFHNNGLNPTSISNILHNKSPKVIASELSNLGVVHHFDSSIASEEEKEAHRQKMLAKKKDIDLLDF